MKRFGLSLKVFCAALVSLMIGVVAGYQISMPYAVRLGEEGDSSYIDGFYEPESNPYDTYRWSEKTAVVRFPGIGCPQALTMRMRMNGARPGGIALPQVILKVNGTRVTQFAPEGHMKVYEFRIPRETTGCSGDVELEIDSETYSPGGGDLRELGVMVDWVVALPERGGIVLPAPLPLASLAVVATIVFLRLRMRQFPREIVVALVVGATIVAGLLFAFHRIQVTRWSWQVLLLTAIGYLALVTLDGICSVRSAVAGIRRRTVVILLLALIVHLVLLTPSLDESPNVWTYKNWIWHANIKGLQSLYLEPWALTQPVYPPVSLYLFTGLGRLYQSVVGPLSPPLEEPSPQLSFLLRLPGVMCNVLLALAVFLWVQPRQGYQRAHLAMAAFAFNPAAVLLTTRWGQMDSIHSFFTVLALICAVRRKPAMAWALISVAASVKPQALLFAPVLLVLTWRRSARRGVLEGTLAATSTMTVVMFPFIESGLWHKVIRYFASLPSYESYWAETIHDSHNLWWLVGLGKALPKSDAPWSLSLPILGPLTYETIGLSLFGMAYLLALWRLVNVREDGHLWAAVAYIAFAFFMLPTAIHANYMYATIALLAMGFLVHKSLPVIYLLLSATWLLNLWLQYPGIDWIGLQKAGLATNTIVNAASMLDAALNTLILGYWTILLMRIKDWQKLEPACSRKS